MSLSRRGLVLGLPWLWSCAHRELSRPDLAALAAALPGPTIDGAPFDATRLRGRVVLVTFIATWCFPCLADLVSVTKLARTLGSRGFVNLLVGMDLEGRRVLEPFAAQYELEGTLLVADEALRSGRTVFGHIRELPFRALFGRDGQLVGAFSGLTSYQALEALVAAELSGLGTLSR